MRHTSIAAITLLAAISTAGCVAAPDPHYHQQAVVVRHYEPVYVPYYAYRSEPAIVFVQQGNRRHHRHDRRHD